MPRAGSRARREREDLELELVAAGRRSASTWSRTKLPSAGASGDGHMFVTISARIGA